jgi:hypothetical protein
LYAAPEGIQRLLQLLEKILRVLPAVAVRRQDFFKLIQDKQRRSAFNAV